MAREFSRTERVGEQIHREVAQILNQEFKHEFPELGWVTVSGVEVSRDLSHAKVFVTFLENDEAILKDNMALLEEHKGLVRGLLGRRVRMRITPTLKFHLDKSITEGMRISGLVTEAIRADEQKKGK